MKRQLMIILFTCVYATAYTQVNLVKNPSFEQYSQCPDQWNKIFYADGWRNATDSAMELGMEYYHVCANVFINKGNHVPDNVGFYQFPKHGNGMAGAHLYNDKTMPMPYPLPFNYRDYLQSRLLQPLTAGREYCVSFWLNSAEAAGYVHNKIGAYLDDGSVNAIADTPGQEIISVIPQVYTDSIIDDTMNWVKVEGSFIATGNETYITIGNFFPNTVVATEYPNYWSGLYTSSYYLIDLVGVIPTDYAANAGPNCHVPEGATVEIGNPDTTALGLDCKWYHKGMLIDSGVRITVPANILVGVTDTYVVVQTICGNVTRDTVTVYTAALGLKHWEKKAVQVYPNPSTGRFSISVDMVGDVSLRVYDLQGRLVHQQQANLDKGGVELSLRVAAGTYLLHVEDRQGKVYRERLQVE